MAIYIKSRGSESAWFYAKKLGNKFWKIIFCHGAMAKWASSIVNRIDSIALYAIAHSCIKQKPMTIYFKSLGSELAQFYAKMLNDDFKK